MKKEELRKLVIQNTQKVVFVKKDGTVRTMFATLRSDIIKVNKNSSFQSKEPVHLLTVWDVIAQGWRRINVDTLISCEAANFTE
jgi:hypothetical protein